MRINKEGYKIIFFSGVVCLLIWWGFYRLLVTDAANLLMWGGTVFLLLFWFFIVAFFREPRRVRIHDADLVFAPCDGRVVVTEVVMENEYLKQEMLQISIFMSITNVHMNWVPVGGRVEYFKYHPGRFLVAWHPKSSTENERTTTVVRMESGQPVLFRQIAGLIARRIVSYMKPGEPVEQNSVCGFIKFGSRVDVLVPKESELLVEIGDPTVGSQTPIARLRKEIESLAAMKTTPQTFLKFIAGTAVAAAVLFLIWYSSSIVVYILVSAVLAVMGRPLVNRLAALHVRGWRVPRWLAALVTLVVIWAVFALCCSLFVPLVFNKINQFSTVDFASVVNSIGEPIARMQRDLQNLFALSESSFSLSDELVAMFRQVVDMESVNRLFSSVVGVVLSSVIALFSISFITFFFLKDDGLFYSMVTAVFPERYHDNITRALDSVTVLLSRYFTGILSESLMLMVAVTLVMMAFGMKAADA